MVTQLHPKFMDVNNKMIFARKIQANMFGLNIFENFTRISGGKALGHTKMNAFA